MTSLPTKWQQTRGIRRGVRERGAWEDECEGRAMRGRTIVAVLAGAACAVQGALVALGGDRKLLRPPGSQGERDFMARCVRCGKCMLACPYTAIAPAGFDAGISQGTPFIDARTQACRLCEDTPCVKACPTDALRDIDRITDIHMGTAVIDESRCLSYRSLRCEVCYRTCPLIDSAISIEYSMREGDAIHATFAPVINEENCVGCGLCVERCPVDDGGPAIVIEPRTGRLPATS